MPKTLSFDCYGTLIDWESGIVAAMQPVISRHELVCSSEDVLAAFARAESAVEAGAYRPYREVLRRTFSGMAKDLGFAPQADELETLVEALPSWRPFPDTVAALRALKAAGHRLVLLSNIDEDLFAPGTAAALEVEFDARFTSAQVRAYKPNSALFEHARARLGLSARDHLHVAQSRYHDLEPCQRLGIPAVHVVRDSGREHRATPMIEGASSAAWTVPDLAAVVALVAELEAGAVAEAQR
ncbi:HAD-IA family hydrolase [Pseudenhygromyxa sp. WMMC2535]|uniref:HAD-IA family hydrolase n=1 Tax=Pseudenhygromyxa sp. WMMC2535 TaxID=2712867 RepID=UPI00155481B2|nr:HAD-IA family hydrolase [Pseudenhygromyxa sp. WMMC2535]